MNTYREPAHDDTACAGCGRALPETVTPFTWNDHGFCHVGCANTYAGALDVRGTEPVIELARAGAGSGPGFEDSLIADWRRELRAVEGGILWLAKRHGPDDQTRASADSWAWRINLTNTRGSFVRCLAFRLTRKDTTQ